MRILINLIIHCHAVDVVLYYYVVKMRGLRTGFATIMLTLTPTYMHHHFIGLVVLRLAHLKYTAYFRQQTLVVKKVSMEGNEG